jgi:hypothetical protein
MDTGLFLHEGDEFGFTLRESVEKGKSVIEFGKYPTTIAVFGLSAQDLEKIIGTLQARLIELDWSGE